MAETKKQLAARVDAAASDLRALAHDITAAIETLPRNSSRSTKELFEQQARRALAIAAALQVESASPDWGMVYVLAQARKGVAVLVLSALSTVTVGALEQAGADAWDAVAERAHQIAGENDQADRADVEFPEALRAFREENLLSREQLGLALDVSSNTIGVWETAMVPIPLDAQELLDRLRQLSPSDIERLRRAG